MTSSRIMSVVFRYVNIGFQWIMTSEENHVISCLYDRKLPVLSSSNDPAIYFDWICILICVSNGLFMYRWCPIMICDLQLDPYPYPLLFVSNTCPIYFYVHFWHMINMIYMHRYIQSLWYINTNTNFKLIFWGSILRFFKPFEKWFNISQV